MSSNCRARIDKSKLLVTAIQDLLRKYSIVLDPNDSEVQETCGKFGFVIIDIDTNYGTIYHPKL